MRISADWILDETGSLRTGHVLSTNGELIESIGPQAQSGGEIDVQYPGCTILPGMIDAHVHLTFSALPTSEEVVNQISGETETRLIVRAVGNAQAALQAGITTVRDCGGRGLTALVVRNAIRDGLLRGPDVLVAGTPITTSNGHLHYLGLLADDEPSVRRAAEQMIEADVDFLKIVATGGNMTPGSDRLKSQYSTDSLRACVDAGRKYGLHTAAHVLARCAIYQCCDAGVHTIEHCAWKNSADEFEFDEAAAKRLAANGQYIGLTMSAPTLRSVRPDVAGLDAALVGDLDHRFDAERRTIDAGVPFMLHTDAGVRQTPFGTTLALGVQAAVNELKLSPSEAIQAVTATPAKALGLNDRGVLAQGKRADLVVVEGNPMNDVAALGRVRGVLRGGCWM